MNRTEFLAALALRLEDLPEDEREEAVKYYSEYLDEVGMDGEDAAIAELGGAEKVSNIIRANCGLGPYRPAAKTAPQPELTLDGPGYAQAVENTKNTAAAAAQAAQAQAARAAQAAQAATAQASATGTSAPTPPTYTAQSAQAFQSTAGTANTAGAANAGAQPITPPVYKSGSANPFSGQAPDARGIYRAASEAGQNAATANVPPTYGGGTQTQYNSNNSRILWILIIIASSPIWLGLVGGFIGLVFGIFGAFVGLMFSGFGTFFAGIVHAALSISLFATSPATALATIGLSLLAAGLGALLGGSMLYASCKVFPWIWRTVGSFFRWLRGKVSGHNA